MVKAAERGQDSVREKVTFQVFRVGGWMAHWPPRLLLPLATVARHHVCNGEKQNGLQYCDEPDRICEEHL